MIAERLLGLRTKENQVLLANCQRLVAAQAQAHANCLGSSHFLRAVHVRQAYGVLHPVMFGKMVRFASRSAAEGPEKAIPRVGGKLQKEEPANQRTALL